ncbi:DNA circularization protein [Vogesella mureinivorans]|uniref:DNA circularization protein n=1 Tax=Vogesella mureinivorans TaxID=657276 RepID=UPI0011CA1F88|nr:DNA circularization N-terminal domain-containing protein [Vogesella mureinivorans]
MAWKDNLLDASFRGVVFDCQATQDGARRDIAQHEYPYQDGADLEDLGRKPRQFTLQAVFFGDDYDTRLQAFLAVLDQPGAGELVHPVYGSIQQAQLLDYQVEHSADEVDSCRVALQFAEHTTSQPFFSRQLPAQQAAQVKLPAAAGMVAATDAFAKATAAAKAAGQFDRINALRSVLTSTLGGLRSQVQGYISAGLELIDYPRAFAADVVGLLSGMADLRGFDVGVIMSDWKSLTGQLGTVVQLPGRVASGNVQPGSLFAGQPGQVGNSTADSATTTTPVAIAPADLQAVTALLQAAAATTLAQVAADVLAAEVEQPTLTPSQLETLAGDVRGALQQAIDSHRAAFDIETARPVTEALKSTAYAVQAATASVLTLRPPLIQRRVDAAANLHLLAFRWYGDYTRASELARLNPQLVHPNFIPAGEVLNGYAA